RTAYRRALAPVEHTELDAGGVRHTAHQPVQGVNLAHEVALAEASDCRIARHRANGVETMRHQRGPCAQARSRSRGLTASMPAADDDDVEIHGYSHDASYAATTFLCKESRFSLGRWMGVSRETGQSSGVSRETGSFADAEAGEDRPEHILD